MSKTMNKAFDVRSFYLMFMMRVFYALLIVYFAFMGAWNVVLYHTICFFISLGVMKFIKDPHYHYVDALLVACLMVAMFPTATGDWVGEKPFFESMIGWDKVLHMLGGACVAMFAAIYAKRHTNEKWAYYIGIISFALAVGAIWEVFEWIFGLLPNGLAIPSNGYADTIMDMVADTIGASVVAVILWYKKYI